MLRKYESPKKRVQIVRKTANRTHVKNLSARTSTRGGVRL